MCESTHFVGYYKNEDHEWTLSLFKTEDLPTRRFYWFGWIDPLTGKINSLGNNDRWLTRLEHVQKLYPGVLRKTWVETQTPQKKLPLEPLEPPSFGIPEKPVESSPDLPKLVMPDDKIPPSPGISAPQTILVYRMEGRITVNKHLDTFVGTYDVCVENFIMKTATYVSGNKRIVPEGYTPIGYTH